MHLHVYILMKKNILKMLNIYKILLVGALVLSCAFARTSGKYEAPESFMRSKISGSSKKIFMPSETKENDNSLKWKRRHKRRKKDTKRKPSRGR